MADDAIVVGWHAVDALLRHRAGEVRELWLDRKRRDARMQRVAEQARGLRVTVRWCERRVLDQRAPRLKHQGVVAILQAEAATQAGDLNGYLAAMQGPALVLVLDGVQDPHNLGACLRTADAAGVGAVVLPKSRSVGLTPTVHKVASGAASTVPVYTVTNLARGLQQLKDAGFWLVGLAAEAEAELFDLDLRGSLALVLGGEGGGLRRLSREACDFLARLPMAGSVSSLNVSVAAGVALYEALRQRRG